MLKPEDITVTTNDEDGRRIVEAKIEIRHRVYLHNPDAESAARMQARTLLWDTFYGEIGRDLERLAEVVQQNLMMDAGPAVGDAFTALRKKLARPGEEPPEDPQRG